MVWRPHKIASLPVVNGIPLGEHAQAFLQGVWPEGEFLGQQAHGCLALVDNGTFSQVHLLVSVPTGDVGGPVLQAQPHRCAGCLSGYAEAMCGGLHLHFSLLTRSILFHIFVAHLHIFFFEVLLSFLASSYYVVFLCLIDLKGRVLYSFWKQALCRFYAVWSRPTVLF